MNSNETIMDVVETTKVDDTTEFEYKRTKKNQNTIINGTSSNNNA